MTTAVAPATPLMLPGWLPTRAATMAMTPPVCSPTTGDTPATTLNARASGTMESETVTPASALVAMDDITDGSPWLSSLGATLGYGAADAAFTHTHGPFTLPFIQIGEHEAFNPREKAPGFASFRAPVAAGIASLQVSRQVLRKALVSSGRAIIT
jgi:hypothetical protein